MEKNYDFISMGDRINLVMANLFAEVNIEPSHSQNISIEIKGDETLLNKISATKKGDEIRLTGDYDEGGGSIHITSTSSFSTSSLGTTTNVFNNCFISGGGVFINGQEVENGKQKTDPAGIQIRVPIGTIISVDNVHWSKITNTFGKLKADLSGDNFLFASDLPEVKLKCSGISKAEIQAVSGDAKISTSGQADVKIFGNTNNIVAEANGSSEIYIQGSCQELNAKTSGNGKIKLLGYKTEKAAHDLSLEASGQSNIQIAGDVADIEAEASGNSGIEINGNCADFDADASGMSKIILKGEASGTIRKKTSGLSKVIA